MARRQKSSTRFYEEEEQPERAVSAPSKPKLIVLEEEPKPDKPLCNMIEILSVEQLVSESEPPSVMEEQLQMIFSPAKPKAAIELLSEDCQPQTIVCREEQQMHIKEFIEGGLEGCGRVNPLIICGVPGVGKTVTLVDICSRLHELHEFDEIFLSLIGKDAERIVYKQLIAVLLENVRGYRKRTPAPILLGKIVFDADQVFTRGQLIGMEEAELNLHTPLLLVLEEVDVYARLSERQDLLYNLLEWCEKPHCNLIVVLVSNRMDVGALFNQRIQSRLGRNQLLFKPYVEAQLQRIVAAKLQGHTGLFAAGALTYAIKKMAVSTTDIRQFFRLLRGALLLLQNSQQQGVYFVTIQLINKAYSRQMADPMTVMLSGLYESTKAVLLSVLLLSKREQECTLMPIFLQSRPFCQNIKTPTQTLSHLNMLQSMNLLRLHRVVSGSQQSYRAEPTVDPSRILECMEHEDGRLSALMRLLSQNDD